ncbi:MAG: hypothetical protein AB8I08_05685 [Sandaracinaceae bacterium]
MASTRALREHTLAVILLPGGVMPEFLSRFLHSPEGQQVIASVVAVVIALGVRTLVVRWIRRNPHLEGADRLRWHGHARSMMLSVLALGLAFFWGSEAQERGRLEQEIVRQFLTGVPEQD